MSTECEGVRKCGVRFQRPDHQNRAFSSGAIVRGSYMYGCTLVGDCTSYIKEIYGFYAITAVVFSGGYAGCWLGLGSGRWG